MTIYSQIAMRIEIAILAKKKKKLVYNDSLRDIKIIYNDGFLLPWDKLFIISLSIFDFFVIYILLEAGHEE